MTHRGGVIPEERIEETVDGENALNERQGAEAEEEVTGAAAPDAATGTGQGTGGMKEENELALQDRKTGTEMAGVYEFPDTKTTGTVTVVKKWDDQSTNAERPRADISISTQKQSKSPLGYTVTFCRRSEWINVSGWQGDQRGSV